MDGVWRFGDVVEISLWLLKVMKCAWNNIFPAVAGIRQPPPVENCRTSPTFTDSNFMIYKAFEDQMLISFYNG